MYGAHGAIEVQKLEIKTRMKTQMQHDGPLYSRVKCFARKLVDHWVVEGHGLMVAQVSRQRR
jgi:hypothetical protein